MRTKIVKDISAGSVQVLINQLLGLLVFFILSRSLDKSVYGEFNWSVAVLGFSVTLLSLRLEQWIVQKIAAGGEPSRWFSLFFWHVMCSGILFCLALALAYVLFPRFFHTHPLLLWIAVSQVIGFFSLPFKQLATGKEKFGWLALMSTVANLVRASWLLGVAVTGTVDVTVVIGVFVVSAFSEWIVCAWISLLVFRVRIARWSMRGYVTLLRDALPQIGMVFLNACIARVDWILLGLFATQTATAEYSFAYKVFELSPVPLLVLGPVLLTRFSAWFGRMPHEEGIAKLRKEMGVLIRLEMILATLFPLLLNLAWSPVMESLTQHKYGNTNALVFLLLSCCIPFQYFINLCWTANFAQSRLKMIFRITLITCVVMLAGDSILIPLFGATGAAIAYLAAMCTEYLLYCRNASFIGTQDKWRPMLTCICIAVTAGGTVQWLALPLALKLALALLLYLLLLIPAGQLRQTDLRLLKQRFFPAPAKLEVV